MILKNKIITQIILILILMFIIITNMNLISYAQYTFQYTIEVAEIIIN